MIGYIHDGGEGHHLESGCELRHHRHHPLQPARARERRRSPCPGQTPRPRALREVRRGMGRGIVARRMGPRRRPSRGGAPAGGVPVGRLQLHRHRPLRHPGMRPPRLPRRPVPRGVRRHPRRGGYVGHVRLHYASASGAWTASPAAAAAAAVADEDDWGFLETAPATLVGSTLYFRSPGRTLLYQFGDEVEQLAYVDIPPFITQQACGTVLMPAADGRLSFAAMYGGAGAGDMRIQFWETEVHAGGDVDWVHIQNALVKIPVPGVQPIGVAASSLFIRTQDDGIISIDVGSGRFQKLPQPGATQISALVPFMSFGTPSDGGNEKSGSIEVSGPRYADAVPVSDSNNSDDAKEEETASSQILLTS
ncbi:hypothetical protein SEVIR_7G142200v4 [Setaria viridis]|uniref:Uncharacterized protein n=1 Tax=Setaria viridis TaxID=4556 RepID=A0A4U6TTR1_SETVI|nr:hypothetical protein SEVIR_7G142200v2 [Setaria viridis]